jgi:hypothetical protein
MKKNFFLDEIVARKFINEVPLKVLYFQRHTNLMIKVAFVITNQ